MFSNTYFHPLQKKSEKLPKNCYSKMQQKLVKTLLRSVHVMRPKTSDRQVSFILKSDKNVAKFSKKSRHAEPVLSLFVLL